MPAMTVPGVGPGGDWDLAAVRKVLWQRRWLVAAIAAEVFLLTALVTFLRTPVYTASARLLIERTTPRVLDTEDVVPMVWNEYEIQRFYQTQYLLLRDPAVLRDALDRYGVREALAPELTEPGEDGEEPKPPTDDQIAAYIRDNLDTEQLEYSSVVRVSFTHPSPEIAANVVNAVVDAYRDFFVRTGVDARRGAADFLERAIQEAQAEVLELEAKLAQARRQAPPTVPEREDEPGSTRLSRLEQTLTEVKAERAAAEARLAAYQEATPSGIPEVNANPQVQRYRQDLAELRRELAELEGKVGPNWPRLVELRAAVKETERNLENEMEAIYRQALESARAELALRRESEARLQRLIEEEQARAAQLQLATGELEALRSLYKQKREALDRLLARREEVAVTRDLQSILERQVHVVDRAKPPKSPSAPRVKLNLALGLLLGLLLGVGGAFGAEALDVKLRTASQMREITGLPLLGSIPRASAPPRPRLVFSRKGRSRSRPVIPEEQMDVEEAFRALRSSILLAQPQHPPRSLLVTSALPGEGKSTIAANLARTLGAFGRKVVLIDADLRHPRLHRVFRVPSERGLTNLLASHDPADGFVVPTRYANLHLLPGGPCPPDPATLLDPDRFREIVGELDERLGFDFVVIDSPPVLVFADALNLVPVVEGTLLVARALSTPKDALRQAVDQLAKVNARILGTILNCEVTEDVTGSYYRSYRYRKGYYRRPAEEEGERASARDAAG
ncbi:MAG: polysaccharide biosynthesis tyrosine autokinase [Acidobacteria bacterium]|nr:MAG: polysaccharide biosynthesis tyrosine autokinase [Acidobacteriota bacterium]